MSLLVVIEKDTSLRKGNRLGEGTELFCTLWAIVTTT